MHPMAISTEMVQMIRGAGFHREVYSQLSNLSNMKEPGFWYAGTYRWLGERSRLVMTALGLRVQENERREMN